MVESISKSSTGVLADLTSKAAMKVLHVDDDLNFLKVAGQCLKMQGRFQVDTARSVEEAVENMKKEEYDAVVSDYQMPGKDGLQFLKELREKGNNIPFIVFTGKGREEIAIKALNLGADQYLDKHGDPETVYCELAHAICQAVDGRSTQVELSKREAKLQAILESSPEAITVIDLNGNIVECNQGTLDMLGYSSKDELIGRNGFALISEKDRERAKGNLAKVLDHGPMKDIEYIALTKDGTEFHAELSASVVKDSSGNPTGFVSIIKDISERKKAEQTLKESTERYRDLVELAPDGIATVNAEGIITSVNRSFLTLIGYSSEEVVGKPFTELKSSRVEDIPKMLEMFESLTRGESPSQVEFLYVRKDGTSRWAEVHPSLLTKDGNPVGALVIMRDVTERRNAEKLIQENQRKFEQLFMSNPEAAVYVDQNERVLNVNPRFTELYGYSFDEVKEKFLDDFVVPEDRKKEALMLAQRGREGYVFFETVRKNKKGSLIPVTMSSSPIVLQGQHIGDMVLYKDVTERKKVEEEKSRLLHDLGERVKELNCLFGMSRLVENSDISLDAVLQGTADLFPSAMQYPDISCARVVIGNQCFSTKNFKETGWKLQADIEVLGKKAGFVEVRYLEERPAIAEGLFLKEERLLIDAIAERLGKITERKKAEEALKDAKQKWASLTENTDGIVMIVDSEGIIQYINRTIPPYTPEETVGKTVYEYVPREQHDTMRSSLKKTFETGVPFNYVVSSNIPKIGTIWFETKVVPVKDDEKTVSAILMSTDVTKLRNTEERLKETNVKLEDTNEKLRVVGGLTRHDARNKLSAVTGNAYLLRRKLAEDPKALEQLNDMETAVRLVEKIFEFARAYEKLGTEQLVSIDVGKAVDGAGSLFSGLKGVKIVNECGGLTVLADSLLSQLFYNLIDNSLKYGEKTRQIRVYYKMSRSDQLDLVYEDDGVGIPDNMRGNLFKEGFTSGKGTGYGLFMIKRMCSVYGWTIQETGIQGKGARFILTVPEKSQQGKPLYKLP